CKFEERSAAAGKAQHAYQQLSPRADDFLHQFAETDDYLSTNDADNLLHPSLDACDENDASQYHDEDGIEQLASDYFNNNLDAFWRSSKETFGRALATQRSPSREYSSFLHTPGWPSSSAAGRLSANQLGQKGFQSWCDF